MIDSEFSLFVPWGVTVHIARFFESLEEIEGLTDGTWQIEKLDAPIKRLALTKASCIAFACTAGTFIGGIDFDRKIIERIKSVSGGIPATTTSSAVVEALNTLNVGKVAVGTPYTNDVNMKLERFLEDNGFKVVSMKGLQYHTDWDISRQPPEIVYQLGVEADKPEAECVFLSCTGMRTAENLMILEEDLEKPVISSNQATMWRALRLAGVRTPVKGYGMLLEKYMH